MNKKNKKIIAPIIITAVFLIICAGMIAFWIWVKLESGMPWIAAVLFGVIYLVAAVCIIAVLIQRIKEIKRGEEDEASKY